MTADTPNIDKALAHVCANTNGAGVYCARTELSALKARVEAAEKEVSERGKDVSMLTSYLRHAMMCGDLDGDCSTCTEARDLLARIDAALQAARESTEPKGS